MTRSLSALLDRARELGLRGTLGRLQQRAVRETRVWGESWWGGLRARRPMTAAALLSRASGPWPSVTALLEHLATRPGSSFMLPYDSAEDLVTSIDCHARQCRSEIVAAADAACRNQVWLLGKRYDFGQELDWLADPATGWRWPSIHRSRVAPLLWSRPEVDPLLVWELNRHQHFVALGLAFALTGDERYVHGCIAHLRSWVASNRRDHGINWVYGLEVSTRLVAWTTAFQFFRRSRTFQEMAGEAFLKSLWEQAEFLSHHLQGRTTPGVVPNNHLLAELIGLVLVGAAFPEFERAAAWREMGLEALGRQVAAQTHEDGVNKEQASGYHRYVAEWLLLAVGRSRQGWLRPMPEVEAVLERMLDVLFGTLMPDGTAPHWGDASSGHALVLGAAGAFWDVRPLLAGGAALFGRPEWKYVAGPFPCDMVLLLGARGLLAWQQLEARPPERPSRAFPKGGIYVIRSAWDADADVAVFRCGPFGLGGDGHCAHSHCDLLSCTLWVQGQPLLVDSGTYTYAGPLRDSFRRTAAHNTVMIDGRDQAVPVWQFNWLAVPEAECLHADDGSAAGVLQGPTGVRFSRAIAYEGPGQWNIADRFAGEGPHTLEWFFHFAPDLELRLDPAGRAVVLRAGRPWVTLALPSGVRPEVSESWYSQYYGVRERNARLRASWEGELQPGGVPFDWHVELSRNTAPSGHGNPRSSPLESNRHGRHTELRAGR
jgi:heparinase II/III-like protein